MTLIEILLVFSALGIWVGAISLIALLFLVQREATFFRQKETFDILDDANFKFPTDLRADETPLAGRFVCHWILHHNQSMKFEEYSRYSHRVQIAILEVVMAYDRVVKHFDLGVSKKAIVKLRGRELSELWRITEPVILQLRKEPSGFSSLCFALEQFVQCDEFDRLLARTRTETTSPIRM